MRHLNNTEPELSTRGITGSLKPNFYGNGEKGVALLLVIPVLSGVLAISLAVFELVFSGLKISGEMNDSFLALYSADQGIENMLYLDRESEWSNPPSGNPAEGCAGTNVCHWESDGYIDLGNSACHRLIYDRENNGDATLTAIGEYKCGNNLSVKRAVQSSYLKN